MTAAEALDVLLVEDDEALAMLERESLEREGFRVIEARAGQKALGCLADSRSLALLVLDYRLPDMTGADIVAHLGDRITSLPVVMVTGYPDPRIEARMRDAGVYDYIIKDMKLEFLDHLPRVAQAAIENRAG
ncbi:MAG: response regulator [Acidobacteriota bacterium]